MLMSNYYKGRLFVNHSAGQGFSESYKFATTDRNDARSWFRDILNYRALLLAKNTEIVWAVLSLVDTQKDSTTPGVPAATVAPPDGKYLYQPAALSTEAGPPPAIEDVNRMKEGYLYNFVTNTGAWTQHLFRGIRDSWVAGMKATFNGVSLIAPGAWTPPAAGFTAQAAINHLLSAVYYRSAWIKKVGPGSYDAVSFADLEYERVGERDCGAGFSFGRGRKKAVIAPLVTP